jgi:predicted O-methyltransferase YrrM
MAIPPPPGPLHDPQVEAVLARLHGEAAAQAERLQRWHAERDAALIHDGAWDWTQVYAELRDAYLALDREQGEWGYLLARAIGARRIVEFGTSFGISTIYWAAAVRDNGGGLVVGSELWPEKAAQARRHVAEAGLAAYVDVRPGDAQETLRDPGGPVDLVLLDGRTDYNLPILRLLEPWLRPGAVVIADNVFRFATDMAPYLAYVQDPANGYRTTTLALKSGTEFTVRA